MNETSNDDRRRSLIRQNDEFSEEEMEMREIAVIKEECTFGEYALIENKPRSATIQCVEDCIFAVLNKQEYTKVLLKIEKKIMNEKALFLKSVPYFSKWTNMAVNKFTYYFHDKSFIRNQEVFKEGQKVEYVYIVKQGEFELTKTMEQEKNEGKMVRDIFNSHLESK